MPQITDTLYNFVGNWKSQAHCHLRIYGGDPDRPTVVIVTELESNPGTSITNAAEILAAQVVRDHDLDSDTLIWVEHYPDRAFVRGRPGLEERFDLVTFQRARPDHFQKPEWQPIPRPPSSGSSASLWSPSAPEPSRDHSPSGRRSSGYSGRRSGPCGAHRPGGR